MSWPEALLLIAGGCCAGVVNTMAGGASILTVPLLVLIGLPGNVANGTNRVGVLAQSVAAAWRFRVEGVPGARQALPVLLPVIVGSMLGASLVSMLPDQLFERLFGVVMVLLLIPVWRQAGGPRRRAARSWPLPLTAAVFLLIGLFGGAFQAGVGLLLIMALSYAGHDLVQANSIKVVVNAVQTAVALPVFVLNGQVEWLPGLVLALGFVLGGAWGVRLTIRGGERLIRVVLMLTVVVLAGRMIGLY